MKMSFSLYSARRTTTTSLTSPRLGPFREDHGGPGRLREVEVGGEVPEAGRRLAGRGPRIRAPVGPGIEAAAGEEPVLDEPQVGVEGERAVIDDALPGVRADHDAG